MSFSAASFILLIIFHTGSGLTEVRWCTISEQETVKCNAMKTAFTQASILPPLSCVGGSSAIICAQMISENKADAVTLNGGTIYQAGTAYNLKPAVGEVYDQGVGTSYYAVAVIHKSSNLTINNLKGAKSCHTGIHRTAGWNVPVGYLTYSGQMPVLGCDFPEAVADFFTKSCVPGANKTVYSETLCGLCSGSQEATRCELNAQEKYYDYSGAFRCLAEGGGDVAFVKHSTVAENTDGRNPDEWARELQSRNYLLLCLDGSRQEVTEWRRCHLAQVPARAVMVRPDTDASMIFGLLNEGQKRFTDGSSDFKMFDSAKFGGNNLLFKDSTTEITMIANPAYQAWLGDGFLNAMKGLNCDPNSLPKSLRWCTLSTAEVWKCSDMAIQFKNKKLKPSVQCVSAETTENCMKMIQNKEIDAVTLGGQDIYTAGKTYGLLPAAGERYAAKDSITSYYAVAVVKRNNQNSFTINELKGKKSCHTGYGRTAGWNIPIGVLIKRGMISPQGCNIAKAASEFFSASCVPGANEKGFPPALCELCKGERNNKCAKSENETYFGYSGAFRCLAEGTGEVAFVKHSTVSAFTDGNSSEPWAIALKSSDYQLLCLNGGLAEIHQYSECNWGQVPARAVMVHPDTNIYAVYGLLEKSQDYFMNGNGTDFSLFDSSKYGGKDLIFKDVTEKIVAVGDKATYMDWLGKEYTDSLEGMQCSSGTAGMAVSLVLLLMSNVLLIRFHL